MVFQSAHRYIHKNWDQIFLLDGIYFSDCPIYHWTAATPVRSNGPWFLYRMPFRRDAMLAMPYQIHSHRTIEPRERIDVCRALSIGRANPVPRRAPGDFSMWLRFAGSLDAGGCLCVSPAVENQMYRSMVRIDNMRQHHEPTHTFARAPCDRWNIASYAPNHPHDCRNPFSCPNRRRTVAVWVDFRMDPGLAYKWIFPKKKWQRKRISIIETFHDDEKIWNMRALTWLYG